jgi:hypothetical protein
MKKQLKRKKLTQDVKLFCDEKEFVEQTFIVDEYLNEETWVDFKHGDLFISMSLENWKKLVELSVKVINNYYGIIQNPADFMQLGEKAFEENVHEKLRETLSPNEKQMWISGYLLALTQQNENR